MRFSTILLTVLSTVTLVSSLSIFTIEEVDTTSEGVMDRPQVPAPQPPARFRQATRAGIIARQKRGPARRQISSSPICNRGVTGSTPYAVFTDAFFYTNNALGSHYRATQEECYAQCESNPGRYFLVKSCEDGGADYGSLCRRHLHRLCWI